MTSAVAAAPPQAQTTYYTTVASPIGPLLLTSDGSALTGLHMSTPGSGADEHAPLSAWGVDDAARAWVADDTVPPFPVAREQLAAYFAGRLTVFDLPLALHGTEFQRRVWAALREIPFGETISYAELARRVSNVAAVRAVGAANGRNPIPIIVPCHRVIGSDGSLTGFGGGLERKRWLLEHEGAQPSLLL